MSNLFGLHAKGGGGGPALVPMLTSLQSGPKGLGGPHGPPGSVIDNTVQTESI